MWTWFDKGHTAAVYVAENEPSIFCGIGIDPLASWLSEGNEPLPYISNSKD